MGAAGRWPTESRDRIDRHSQREHLPPHDDHATEKSAPTRGSLGGRALPMGTTHKTPSSSTMQPPVTGTAEKKGR